MSFGVQDLKLSHSRFISLRTMARDWKELNIVKLKSTATEILFLLLYLLMNKKFQSVAEAEDLLFLLFLALAVNMKLPKGIVCSQLRTTVVNRKRNILSFVLGNVNYVSSIV